MILCMPTIGQKVRVLDGQEWSFKLYQERRNETMYEYVGSPLLADHRRSYYDDFVGGQEGFRAHYARASELGQQASCGEPERKSITATLPAGTVLTIDRIYIRKGASDFDSISFFLDGAKLPGRKGIHSRVRFWVKLDDVNSGNLELLPLEG